MIDTLKISKRLQGAGASPQLADEEAQLWAEIISGELATMQNLKETEAILRIDLKEIEAKLRKDIRETEANLQKDIRETEAKLQKHIKELDIKISGIEANLKKDIKELDIKISGIEANLKKDIREIETNLEKEISQHRHDLELKIATQGTTIIKWVAGFLVGQTALLFALIRLAA